MLSWLFGKGDDERGLRKDAERVLVKRSQAPERWEAINRLSKRKTAQAVTALLPRFGFYIEPSMSDAEEKEMALKGVIETGEVAIEPVRAYLRRSESISWPLKMFDALLPSEDVIIELLSLLSAMDTEYERDPQKKIDVLTVLTERQSTRVVPEVVRFLKDVNETVRFSAVGAMLAQINAQEAQEALQELIVVDDSLRVRARILDGFVAKQWQLKLQGDVAARLVVMPYRLGKDGMVIKG